MPTIKIKNIETGEWEKLPAVKGAGVPTGGTTGQILRKKSDSDNDTEWVDNLDTYSTEETIVGTWNGKPLYRKMFIIDDLPNNTYVYLEGYDYSVCRLIDARGVIYVKDREEQQIRCIIPVTGSSNTTIVAQDQIGGLYVQVNFDGAGYSAEINVEYTKTTD